MEIHYSFPNVIQNHEKNENFKNRRIFHHSNFDKVLACQRVLEYHKNWKSLIQKTFFRKLNFSLKDPSHFWFFGTVLGPKSKISCTKILEYWIFSKNVRLWNAITFSDLNIFFDFLFFEKLSISTFDYCLLKTPIEPVRPSPEHSKSQNFQKSA